VYRSAHERCLFLVRCTSSELVILLLWREFLHHESTSFALTEGKLCSVLSMRATTNLPEYLVHGDNAYPACVSAGQFVVDKRSFPIGECIGV
jgi:hypothetical protein